MPTTNDDPELDLSRLIQNFQRRLRDIEDAVFFTLQRCLQFD
jgi:hypothetical protein